MAVRKADAVWKGNLNEGGGSIKIGSGLMEAPYTFKARVEEEGGKTNPEELLGAALASCYAMFLSSQLSKAGHTVNRVQATANVHLRQEGGLKVSEIALDVVGDVTGIDAATFQDFAEKAKTGCPISQAIATTITLNARLGS